MTKQSKSTVNVNTYRKDPVYPRVVRAVEQILAQGKVVAPVDVLVRMSLLTPERLEDWRRGRVPYLERVIVCNLSRLSKILRVLRFHAADLKLNASITVYNRWGKGAKQRLRFTKTGEPRLEEAYATHFVRPVNDAVQAAGTLKERPQNVEVPDEQVKTSDPAFK